jgi:hypothetical protein
VGIRQSGEVVENQRNIVMTCGFGCSIAALASNVGRSSCYTRFAMIAM